MVVYQISKSDNFGGGASKVAGQLNELLNETSDVQNIHLASWTGGGYTTSVKSLYGKLAPIIRRLHFYIKKIGLAEYFPFEYYTIPKNKNAIYHFHDLSSAISPKTLMKLATKGYNVVWTIHDCSPFTGGCLYPMGCEKYKNNCGDCPQLGEWPIDGKLDFTSHMHSIKAKLHALDRITLVFPSQWMADFALESGMSRKKYKIIANCADEDTYQPNDKFSLGKSNKLKVVLSAGDINDRRKGAYYAVSVLNIMKEMLGQEILLVIVGNANSKFDESISNFERYYTGYVSEPKYMADYLSYGDLFLFCSLADNMPLSILESLSCGTPVFGFNTGGIPEVIENDYNGYLVDQGEEIELANKIISIYVNNEFEEYRTNALKSSVHYHKSRFVNEHLSLYREILNDN